MKTTFDALPTDTRKALARAELRKRGLRIDRTDPALSGAIAALRAGVAALPGFVSFNNHIRLLDERIEDNTVTPEDAALLASVPNCSLSAAELVQLFAEIERSY